MLLGEKVVVITGAGSPRGIGAALAGLVHEHGGRVVLLDVNAESAAAIAADIGPEHIGLGCDVTSEDQCARAIEQTMAKMGRIDALVNNAGITEKRSALEIERAGWDRMLDVNLLGGLLMSQKVLPPMIEAGSGSIVFISSVTAQRGGGIFGGAHYAAAKAGAIGLTKSMAREFGPRGIRVNAVAPGVIDTDITNGQRTYDERLGSVKGAPIARLGTAREVAGACLYLISDLSTYTTGSVIDVNGGLHIH